MKISYHTWVDYKECPKKFYLKHVTKEPPLIPRNDYFTIYGKLVEKFFQYFCNVWRFKMPYMPPEEIRFKLKRIYDNLISSSVINWHAPFVKASQEEIFEQACNDVCAIMDSPNQNYFLNTKAEVSIEVSTKYGIDITGRLDFIHFNPLSKEPVIFDGKGTDKMGKNISNDQVLYYALLYFFHYKQVPVSLGFFYYRFNTFSPIGINLNTLNEFRAKLSLDIKQILQEKYYNASPSSKACKWCGYQTVCRDCMAFRASRKKESKLELPYSDNVMEMGL